MLLVTVAVPIENLLFSSAGWFLWDGGPGEATEMDGEILTGEPRRLNQFVAKCFSCRKVVSGVIRYVDRVGPTAKKGE
jgi:hypothetical protein